MKNQIALTQLLLCIILSGVVFSQGIYFKAGGSYRLGLPSSLISNNYTSNYTYQNYSPYNSSSSFKIEGVYGTFGKGVGFDGAVGYKGENLGLEVGVSYLLKSSIETTSKYRSTSQSSPTSSTTYTEDRTNTYESSMMAISPCFVFATNAGFYGRAGAILAFPKFTQKMHEVSTGSTPAITDRVVEYSGNMALGFTGAVGIAIGSDAIKLYIEADVVSLTWAPAQGEIVEYKEDGKDQLAGMTVEQKKARFEETASYNSSTPPNPNVESVSLKSYYPYSSVGLKAGIMIGF